MVPKVCTKQHGEFIAFGHQKHGWKIPRGSSIAMLDLPFLRCLPWNLPLKSIKQSGSSKTVDFLHKGLGSMVW